MVDFFCVGEGWFCWDFCMQGVVFCGQEMVRSVASVVCWLLVFEVTAW